MVKVTNVMTVEEIINALSDLRLPDMRQSFIDQQNNPAFAKLSFNQRMGIMVHNELESRGVRRIDRLLKESGLRLKDGATLESIKYNKARNLKKGLVEELAECRWIEKVRSPSVVVTGSTGTGKSWLLNALGRKACEKGLSVLYVRFADLLESLSRASAHNESINFRRRMASKKLLIIDDFGMSPMSDQNRSDFLSLMDERIGYSATIFGAQLPLEEWHEYIGEAYHSDAIIDRIKNYSYLIELEGPSLRENKKPELS